MQCTAAEWREMCERARATIPPPHRYSWRFMWSASLLKAGDYGTATLNPKPYELELKERGVALVKVARGLSMSETEETLIHEIAHALDSWSLTGAGGGRGDHDEHYWLVYGKVWRAMAGARTG
jgi:hypothetical protein